MTYFFKETKTNIVNLLFITDSYRICQKLRDLKAFQVTFKRRTILYKCWYPYAMQITADYSLTSTIYPPEHVANIWLLCSLSNRVYPLTSTIYPPEHVANIWLLCSLSNRVYHWNQPYSSERITAASDDVIRIDRTFVPPSIHIGPETHPKVE
jgi:hypothetical protein